MTRGTGNSEQSPDAQVGDWARSLVAKADRVPTVLSPWVQRALQAEADEGAGRRGIGRMHPTLFSEQHTHSLLERVGRKVEGSRVWRPDVGSVSPRTFDHFAGEIIQRHQPVAEKYEVEIPDWSAENETSLVLAPTGGPAVRARPQRGDPESHRALLEAPMAPPAKSQRPMAPPRPPIRRVAQRKPGAQIFSRVEEITPGSQLPAEEESVEALDTGRLNREEGPTPGEETPATEDGLREAAPLAQRGAAEVESAEALDAGRLDREEIPTLGEDTPAMEDGLREAAPPVQRGAAEVESAEALDAGRLDREESPTPGEETPTMEGGLREAAPQVQRGPAEEAAIARPRPADAPRVSTRREGRQPVPAPPPPSAAAPGEMEGPAFPVQRREDMTGEVPAAVPEEEATSEGLGAHVPELEEPSVEPSEAESEALVLAEARVQMPPAQRLMESAPGPLLDEEVLEVEAVEPEAGEAPAKSARPQAPPVRHLEEPAPPLREEIPAAEPVESEIPVATRHPAHLEAPSVQRLEEPKPSGKEVRPAEAVEQELLEDPVLPVRRGAPPIQRLEEPGRRQEKEVPAAEDVEPETPEAPRPPARPEVAADAPHAEAAEREMRRPPIRPKAPPIQRPEAPVPAPPPEEEGYPHEVVKPDALEPAEAEVKPPEAPVGLEAPRVQRQDEGAPVALPRQRPKEPSPDYLTAGEGGAASSWAEEPVVVPPTRAVQRLEEPTTGLPPREEGPAEIEELMQAEAPSVQRVEEPASVPVRALGGDELVPEAEIDAQPEEPPAKPDIRAARELPGSPPMQVETERPAPLEEPPPLVAEGPALPALQHTEEEGAKSRPVVPAKPLIRSAGIERLVAQRRPGLDEALMARAESGRHLPLTDHSWPVTRSDTTMPALPQARIQARLREEIRAEGREESAPDRMLPREAASPPTRGEPLPLRPAVRRTEAAVSAAPEPAERLPLPPVSPLVPVEVVQRLPLAVPPIVESVQRAEADVGVPDLASEEEEAPQNLDHLARQVYPIIRRMLAVESERLFGR